MFFFLLCDKIILVIKMIYLDYSATTPVDKKVLDTFNKVCIEYPGNVNSLHDLGIKSKNLENYITEEIAKLLNVKSNEIIYTSGSSESNNLAIKGVVSKYKNRGKHIITTFLEHSSVIAPLNYLANNGYDVDFVNIKEDGLVDLDNLSELINDNTILVSISLVDSEIGIRQNIEEISKIVRKYPKCIFHVDMTQAVGKVDLPIQYVDLASISGHKIYGLKGIGLLIKKENIQLEPLIHGGKSTTIYRSGTPALPLIASMKTALELVLTDRKEHYNYVKKLNTIVIDELKKYPKIHINSTENSIPYTINFSIKDIKPETLIRALSSREIYVSTKSACSSSDSMSNSIYALTHDQELSNNSLRISLSYKTTEEEIKEFLVIFRECYDKLDLRK